MHIRRISALAAGGGRPGWSGRPARRKACASETAASPHLPGRRGGSSLLRRERERQSLRWNQFHLLMAGKAPMPEPGFAQALYYQVSGSAEAGPAGHRLGAGRAAPICANWRWSSTGARICSPRRNRKPWPPKSRAASSKAAAIRSCRLCGPACWRPWRSPGTCPTFRNGRSDEVVHKWWQGEILPAIKAAARR